ncbi:MAG: DUF1156 domain-containing protein [Lachnospiraceae bacterium]|nr:DUF1156 domain-containing protein [Lachnospiraceae bacterium]
MAKKLIEVALPLEAINKEAAHEKMPGIGAHPRGLHLWWARRPFTAARAVICASLIDDPSEHPELFPTEEEQTKERERLFNILSNLVVWEDSNNEAVLEQAKTEILKYTDGNPPVLLDPFAGGGAIPLEAQRLGLEAHAHDLNPVAVMINKAMIEIPPRFAGKPPVNPTVGRMERNGWQGAAGLARDVEYYGRWMKEEAYKRIGHLYPKVKVPREQGGGEATVIAWIWARTVKCPNPACGCEMPLAHSFTLSKKKGKEAWIEPVLKDGKTSFQVHQGGKPKIEGTINRKGAICPFCNMPVEYPYIRNESREERMGALLMAVVAEGKNRKIYLDADETQVSAADVRKPDNYPDGNLAFYPGHLNTNVYGLDEFHKLFTNRQLTALTTFSDLVAEAQEKATADAVATGMVNDFVPLTDGGNGATAYGQAVGVYLTFGVDRLVDFSSAVSRWSPSNEKPMNCFSRQAIPMTWDFPEANPLGDAVGSFSTIISYISDCVATLPRSEKDGTAKQFDAQSDCGLRNVMISTDPPYYDNIGYADLSDFFYVWMRRSLKNTYPDLFRTMLVPKAEELIATPYRHEGSTEKAKQFFEDGMLETCKQLYKYASDDIPVTIYYAYKQSDTDAKNQTASSGWETMLSAIIQAGFAITGTWPMRTEQTYRAISMGSNALASSIVLVCRKRSENARTCTRRDFITALKRELKPALQKLQQSNIAPVDLAQSAIGPGIGVFSRYKKVLEANGSEMTVRSALQIINQELDLYFSGQDSAIDSDSRLCVELFTQYAYNTVKFGDADILARAKGTSVAKLAGQDILYAAKGDVRLLTREELPEKVDSSETNIWKLTQQLTRAMETGGINACAEILAPIFGSNGEEAKNLAYRLYSICERKNWAQEAYAYNALVVAWPEIQSKAAEINAAQPVQMTIFDLGGE